MLNSFKYAINGIKDAIESELNLRFHFIMAFLAFVSAILLKFTNLELAILVLTIFFVIILEFINTAVEKLADIVHPEKSEKIRFVKDISAGVVFLGAVTSIIVGLLLFLPKLF